MESSGIFNEEFPYHTPRAMASDKPLKKILVYLLVVCLFSALRTNI